MKLFNWKKTIHLVRGLPGEGKSTLALKLVHGNKEQVVENDYFWITPDNKYEYKTEMTHLAGWWCFAEAFRRLQFFDEIAVANTFVFKKHIVNYIEESAKLGINVKIYRPDTNWVNDIDQCFSKNIHGVPFKTIERMKNNFEKFSQEDVDIIINKEKRDIKS